MRAARRAGFTLIEMLIATSLIGLVIASSLAIATAGTNLWKSTNLIGDSEAKARRSLARCVQELERAGLSTMPVQVSAVDGTDTITFLQITDVIAGAVVWSNSMRLARVAAPEDPDDGLDNDADGVVDEGNLVLTRDVGMMNERSYVLCTNLRELAEGELPNGVDDNGNGLADESGFNVQLTSNLLTIRICVEEPGEGTATAISSVITSFNLRN